MEIVRWLAIVLRSMWPFIKDQFFEGQSFRRWVGRHKFQVAVAGGFITVSVALFTVSMQNTRSVDAYTALKAKYLVLLEEQKEFDATLARCRSIQDHLRKEYADVQKRLSEADEELDTHKVWIAHCGLETQLETNQCPVTRVVQAPTPRSTPSPTRRTRNRTPAPQQNNDPKNYTRPYIPYIEVSEQEIKERRIRNRLWRRNLKPKNTEETEQ